MGTQRRGIIVCMHRKQFCRVWRGQNGWWWDKCAGCRWRIGNAVWICTVFWVFRAWLGWWGGVDWGGLGMWNVRMGMIGCWPVERCRWQGWDVSEGKGRLGMNVWRMIWRRLVCILNGQCSGICGEASCREERLTLAERGRNGRFKNKWWWWWWIWRVWMREGLRSWPLIVRNEDRQRGHGCSLVGIFGEKSAIRNFSLINQHSLS